MQNSHLRVQCSSMHITQVLYAHHLLHIHRVQQAPVEASHFGMPDEALHP